MRNYSDKNIISTFSGAATRTGAIMMEQEYCSDHDGYEEFEAGLQIAFDKAVASGKKLFTTNVGNLYDLYLNNLPGGSARQHYTCRSCENFINRYGGLVTIDENGKMESALWDLKLTPQFFIPAVVAMKNAVINSKVNGVFIPEERVLGVPRTGEWSHLSIKLPQTMVNRSVIRTSYQVMAEKKEDFKMLTNALLEFSGDTVEQALALLQSESLYRSEKVLGVAKFFHELIVKRASVNHSIHRTNLVWLAVANAPTGFTHIRSSMIGTLLEDIESGMSFNLVSRRFADKMDGTKYQRPQVAPSAGNIAQAEKIVEKLGIQNSLARRFARLDEIETLWTPKPKASPVKSGGGMFSHLEAKGQKAKPTMNIPVTTMTWDKFIRTVLPTAEEIEYKVKSNDNYSAILTAQYEDAPPILQWDHEEKRNPFSWYVYNGGSSASRWNLTPGYQKVTGITYQPSMWYEEAAYQGKSAFLILEGAKDNRSKYAGNALFPETLKSELREIRSTIEAYSKSASLDGYDEASACGVRLQAGSTWSAMIRVTTKLGIAEYKLDRWD